MDPLSEAVSLLNARSIRSASLGAGGDWAIRFRSYDGIKFTTVKNPCWITVDGTKQPIRLQAGDCYFLTRGAAYCIGSGLDVNPSDAREWISEDRNGITRFGDRVGLTAASGCISVDESASLLLSSLPPVVHVRAQTEQAAILRWILEQLPGELSRAQAGTPLMASHFTHIMLLQVLRAYLSFEERPEAGWLGALSDKRIRATIDLMHGNPARRWTLNDLAAAAGMSRSVFALRFSTLAGVPPLDYLLRWRMQLATHALRNGSETVSSIALSLGYESESSFSKAFKRVVGNAPLHYRRAIRQDHGAA